MSANGLGAAELTHGCRAQASGQCLTGTGERDAGSREPAELAVVAPNSGEHELDQGLDCQSWREAQLAHQYLDK